MPHRRAPRSARLPSVPEHVQTAPGPPLKHAECPAAPAPERKPKMPSAVARKFLPRLKLRRAAPAPPAPAPPTAPAAPDADPPPTSDSPARTPRRSSTAHGPPASASSSSDRPRGRSHGESTPRTRTRADRVQREQHEQLSLFRTAALHPSMTDDDPTLGQMWTIHSVNVLNYHDPPRQPVDTSSADGWSEWGGFARHVPRRPSAPASAASAPARTLAPARQASTPNLRLSMDSLLPLPAVHGQGQEGSTRLSCSFARSHPSLTLATASGTGDASSSRASLSLSPSGGTSPCPSSATSVEPSLASPLPRKSGEGQRLWARIGLAPRRSSVPDAEPRLGGNGSGKGNGSHSAEARPMNARSASLPSSALMPAVVEHGEPPPAYEEVEQLA